MDRAVARICEAVARRERIVAYGDYDVDGVTATVQLVDFLTSLGADVGWYIPHRLTEGYGLNPAAVERLAAQGTKLIVTLDCGVTAVAEVDRAAELGVDVVVVDHHRVSPELPRAVALLNPQQPDCQFPSKELCAAGVTFFLLVALRRRLREQGAFTGGVEPDLRPYLDLVALGTIADVVPLLGVNRLLVRAGLRQIGRTARPGLKALIDVAGLDRNQPIGAGQVGFRLAPRLNAAGRLDDAGRAVRLLLRDASAEDAQSIAKELDEENRVRQQIEGEILSVALTEASGRMQGPHPPSALVMASPGWHPGVVGIVASRLVERTRRPTLLLAIDGEEARGSGRSIAGFDLHAALASCDELLTRYGGHRMAAGLTLPAKDVPALRERLERWAAERITAEQFEPQCRIDAQVTPGLLNEQLAEQLEQLAPFGAGNPEPMLAAFGLRGHARVLEAKQRGAEPHLKLQLPREGRAVLDAIGFGLGAQAPLCDGPIDAAFHLGLDQWQGQRRLQLRLRSLRAAEARPH
jgi:single-stranded-DNA-specific exonuclease